jgi:hypothetical protein
LSIYLIFQTQLHRSASNSRFCRNKFLHHDVKVLHLCGGASTPKRIDCRSNLTLFDCKGTGR